MKLKQPSILSASHYHFVEGGSDRYFYGLNKLLEDNGHDVFQFCSADPRNEPYPHSEYFPKHVNTRSPGLSDIARSLYSMDARKKLRRLLNNHPVDIAHLQIFHTQLSGSILKPLKERGIPIIHTMHEYKLLCPI
jgi:hypothetical protein